MRPVFQQALKSFRLGLKKETRFEDIAVAAGLFKVLGRLEQVDALKAGVAFFFLPNEPGKRRLSLHNDCHTDRYEKK